MSEFSLLKSFTAASSDIATYAEVENGGGHNQFLELSVHTNGTGLPTVEVVWTDDSGLVVAMKKIALGATTRKTSADNMSGNAVFPMVEIDMADFGASNLEGVKGKTLIGVTVFAGGATQVDIYTHVVNKWR